MIYTVTFNPSLDYVVELEDVNMGKVNRTKGETIYPGGKGINVSIVLSNLGVPNIAYGFTAGATGEMLKEMLHDHGVSAEFIHVPNGLTRINVKMKSNSAVETELNGQGPYIYDEAVEELYSQLDEVEDGDYLVVSGSIPSSMKESAYVYIMEKLKDKDVKIVVDTTKELMMSVLPYKPFLVKPNKTELEEMFGKKMDTRRDIETYARELQNMGARNVLVSLSEDGAILIDENGNLHEAKAPQGKVKYAVGAGDAMVAGFITGYTNYDDYEKALIWGVCAGSATAFSDYLATENDVKSLIRMNF